MIRTALAAAFAAGVALPAQACRLALVLAMDVSTSVDAAEDALQRGGVAAALRSPAVQQAFLASETPVALAVFEWSGRQHQRLLQDWVMIESAATLDMVAVTIATSSGTQRDLPTAIGYALGYASGLLARAPRCDVQTIDVSGDGVNNDGFDAASAYAAFGLNGVTVNGLVIKATSDDPLGADQMNLPAYYIQNVIQGPAAFVEIADGFEDLARAMQIKLIRELGVRVVGQSDQPAQPDPRRATRF